MGYVISVNEPWCGLAAGYYVCTQVPAPALIHYMLAYMIGVINAILVMLILNKP